MNCQKFKKAKLERKVGLDTTTSYVSNNKSEEHHSLRVNKHNIKILPMPFMWHLTPNSADIIGKYTSMCKCAYYMNTCKKVAKEGLVPKKSKLSVLWTSRKLMFTVLCTCSFLLCHICTKCQSREAGIAWVSAVHQDIL